MALVQRDTTEDVYVSVARLNRGGPLRCFHSQFMLDEGTLREAQQPKILRVGLQPVQRASGLPSDGVRCWSELALYGVIFTNETGLGDCRALLSLPDLYAQVLRVQLIDLRAGYIANIY